MNPGTEELVKKVQHVTNKFGEDGEMVKPATRYLTMSERVDREGELTHIDDFLNQPPAILRSLNIPSERLGNLRGRRKRIKKELDNSSPPTDLTGEEKDAIYALEKQMAEKIQNGMPDHETMIRNPVGAVDWNMRHMSFTKIPQLIWKNCRRILNPQSADKDLANVERLRRRTFMPGGPSMFDPNAQAGGHMAFGHIPDDKWEAAGLPLVNPNSPLAQAEKREEELKAAQARIAKLEAELSAKGDKTEKKAGMSAESKEKMRQMMKKRWADKRAAQAGA